MEIELCGYKVQIDEEDYEKVMALKWWLGKSNVKQGKVYFYHTFYDIPTRKKHHESLHRFLIGLVPHDGFQCDHISGDPLDNRKCNLRICTILQNNRNAKKRKDNSTGYKGVSYNKRDKRYNAAIVVNNTSIYLGSYTDPVKAYAAYCEASKKYHGEFSRLE